MFLLLDIVVRLLYTLIGVNVRNTDLVGITAFSFSLAIFKALNNWEKMIKFHTLSK